MPRYLCHIRAMEVVFALVILAILGMQIDNRRVLLKILHKLHEQERQ